MNVYAKFHCTPLCIKKALGIFRELITTTKRTSRVAFWDPPSGSKRWPEEHKLKVGAKVVSYACAIPEVQLWDIRPNLD